MIFLNIRSKHLNFLVISEEILHCIFHFLDLLGRTKLHKIVKQKIFLNKHQIKNLKLRDFL